MASTSQLPSTDDGRVAGSAVSARDRALEAAASLVQSFKPLSSVCAYLNALHLYGADPARCVEAHHYCAHLSSDVRQCLIFDSAAAGARLIGVEYMITPRLYATLDADERRLWHSHVHEVKSGQLVMPQPDGSVLPAAAWEKAETEVMKEVVGLYGKTWHLWQVDRGDLLPVGVPQLMVSVTGKETDGVTKTVEKMVRERDERCGVDHNKKMELRKDIHEPEIHPDADCWDKGLRG